ncbi:Protein of unknown function [Cotesia congregata]|uniref:Transposase domain-containing protein n=1 Tax=Cotesia congregata TaxID=51543 RepID=A0A8J2EDL5_COTCN|nr:Protein of unknown function [Cotesia congregata]
MKLRQQTAPYFKVVRKPVSTEFNEFGNKTNVNLNSLIPCDENPTLEAVVNSPDLKSNYRNQDQEVNNYDANTESGNNISHIETNNTELLTKLPNKLPSKQLNSKEENSSIKIPMPRLINYLLTLVIKWRRNTTFTVASDISRLLNIATDVSDDKSSSYHFKKIIDKYSQRVTTHYMCIECGNYLGSIRNRIVQCDSCLHKVKNEGELDKSFFLHLPLEDQLREIFETTEAHNLHSKNRKKIHTNGLEDIYDGKLYKKRICNDNTISINFSVDGAPIFDSSNSSVYPILCTINELDPIKRRNHIMLSSIWFGTGKPKSMNGYLKPFVDEATKLFNKGFKYVYTGQEYKKYVVILMGVCDSVARPILRCSTQFNGEYGCGLCLHPGESIAKGRGHARVYPIVNGNALGEGLRSHRETLRHAEEK